MKTPTKTLFCTFALGLGLSLSVSALAATERTEREEMQLAFAKIDGMKTVVADLVKVDRSCKSIKDCTVLPMGKKACGGPSEFVVASKRNKAYAGLLVAIKSVTSAQAQAIADFGLMSTCSIEMPPQIACVEDVCSEL